MRLCIYKSYLAYAVILGSVSGIFRHIRALYEHTHVYSEPCVSLAYSEPWHIPITKHIQTPRYILNIISWTFDTVPNVSRLSLIDAI